MMESTSRLTLNLQYPNIAQVAYAMQGDRLSRAVVADLIDGSTPWAPPAGAYGLITASKPDGTFAVYDTLEDGSPAIVIDGSTVTLYLAEQVLADAGAVKMSVAFFTSAGARLTTFRWTEVVAPEAVLDRVISENYISVFTATMDQILDDLDEAQTILDAIKAAYGAPLTANTAAAMTDTTRVYVYTGTTTSTLTNGHWYYWDGSAWTDGGNYNSTGFQTDTTLTIAGAAADAKAAGDAVGDLKDALSAAIRPTGNLLKILTYNAERYWQHGNIAQSISQTSRAYEALQIKAGTTYYYRSLYAYFCNIKYADGTVAAFSENTSNAMNGNFTALQDGEVYLTVHTNYLNLAIFTDAKEAYDTANTKLYYVPNDLTIYGFTNVYTVKKDGTGDFTKVTDAIKEAVKYKNSIVYIYEGDYDLVEEFGTDLNTGTAEMGGMFLKNGIHLIGTPKSRILFNYTGDNDIIKQYWSVFNANTDGFTLENINIEASNIRYCVHDELNGYTEKYENKYINCSMYLDNSENTVFPAPQCIGGGLGSNGSIIIQDCIFNSVETNWGQYEVSYHNTSLNNAKSRIVISGCYFIGDNARARMTYHGISQLVTDVLVHGNSFAKVVGVWNEASGDTIQNMNVMQWNNEIRNP